MSDRIACGFLFVFLAVAVLVHSSTVSLSYAQETATAPTLKVTGAVARLSL
jgi:hypothetical protein